uniref:Uncharacterized protein n=1 Tax=Romanomermis culicivorax TaxID=13658 RepID=A0A915JT11_ROMCU
MIEFLEACKTANLEGEKLKNIHLSTLKALRQQPAPRGAMQYLAENLNSYGKCKVIEEYVSDKRIVQYLRNASQKFQEASQKNQDASQNDQD